MKRIRAKKEDESMAQVLEITETMDVFAMTGFDSILTIEQGDR